MKYYHNCSNITKSIVFLFILGMLMLTACSSHNKHNNTEQVKTVIQEDSPIPGNKDKQMAVDYQEKEAIPKKENVGKEKEEGDIKKGINTEKTKKTVDIQAVSSDGKYTFAYHEEDAFVQLKIPKDQWRRFTQFEYYNNMPNQKGKGMTISLPWTNFIYDHIADDYDFIIYILNTEVRPEKLFMNGFYQGVKNDIIGIGAPNHGEALYDYTKNYSEHANRLQGIIFLTHNDVIYDGPLLHEIMHRWGNYIINTGHGSYHWGDTNVYGRLGGYKELKEIEDKTTIISYKRYWGGPYAPFELYLMGLLPKEEVPDITIMEDYSVPFGLSKETEMKDGKDIIVKGDIKTKTYPIEKIINGELSNDNQLRNLGERMPHYKDAQKEFNILFVTIDYDDVTEKQKQTINHQIKQLSFDGANDDDIYNFWEACKGKAAMKTDIKLAN